MTEQKQDRTKAEQAQTQAFELEEAKLEQAAGGGYENGSDYRTGGGGTVKGIRDGTSN